jgi:hypothetical protein
LPVSNLVGKLKGTSAYFLRKEYHVNIAKAYIENQRNAPNQKAINQAKRAAKNNACLTRL